MGGPTVAVRSEGLEPGEAWREVADARQAAKLEALEACRANPTPAAIDALVRRVDELNGRAGHTANVLRLAQAFLRDPEVLRAMPRSYRGHRAEDLLEAARVLSLGDVRPHAGHLGSARRPQSPENQDPVGRAERAAGLWSRLVPKTAQSETTRALLWGHGRVDTRPGAERLLKLVDDAATWSAGPRCRDEGGRVHPGRLEQMLLRHAVLVEDLGADAVGPTERDEHGAYRVADHYGRDVIRLMVDFARRGGLDAAVTARRSLEDVYGDRYVDEPEPEARPPRSGAERLMGRRWREGQTWVPVDYQRLADLVPTTRELREGARGPAAQPRVAARHAPPAPTLQD